MDISSNNSDSASPSKAISMMCRIAEYEEEIRIKLKAAYDDENRQLVYELVGELLYKGPASENTK